MLTDKDRRRGYEKAKSNPNFGSGRRRVEYGYTLADVAEVAGMSIEGARSAMRRGGFDLGDFRSVIDFVIVRLMK